MADAPRAEAETDRVPARAARHGYPPPALPPGTRTTAYCGVTMVVEGAYSSAPPADTCPLCALVWERRHRG